MGVTVEIVAGLRSNLSVKRNSQLGWGIVVGLETHIDPVGAHHKASLEIVSPWESISEQQLKALENHDVFLSDFQTNVVDGVVAWDISCRCMDHPRLALLRRRWDLSSAESSQWEKLYESEIEDVRLGRLDIARMRSRRGVGFEDCRFRCRFGSCCNLATTWAAAAAAAAGLGLVGDFQYCQYTFSTMLLLIRETAATDPSLSQRRERLGSGEGSCWCWRLQRKGPKSEQDEPRRSTEANLSSQVRRKRVAGQESKSKPQRGRNGLSKSHWVSTMHCGSAEEAEEEES